MANILYQGIIERKKELGLTNRELADLSGMNVVTIQKIERDEDISLASLRDVCFALDLVVTTIDRSEIVMKEIEEKDAEIAKVKKQLDDLESERRALASLIKK